VTERAQLRQELEVRASVDALTSCLNRAATLELVDRTVSAPAGAGGGGNAVVFIDLDRFKAVNDAAGHAAGDAVLCNVAEACRATMRSSDTVARLGGDEFAIIIENCAPGRARQLGQKILQALNPLETQWKGAHYNVGASIGLAMITAEMPDEKAWLEAADRACYIAKREGRGQLQIAASMQDELRSQQA